MTMARVAGESPEEAKASLICLSGRLVRRVLELKSASGAPDIH